MATIEFDKNPQIVEINNTTNELHFNFARPYVKFNKTPGLYEFDAGAQEVHFDIDGSIGVGGSGDCNSCFPDGGIKDDVLVKQSSANGDANWTNILDSGGF